MCVCVCVVVVLARVCLRAYVRACVRVMVVVWTCFSAPNHRYVSALPHSHSHTHTQTPDIEITRSLDLNLWGRRNMSIPPPSPAHKHAHTRTHARTHARKHTRASTTTTHTHTHTHTPDIEITRSLDLNLWERRNMSMATHCIADATCLKYVGMGERVCRCEREGRRKK